MKVCNRCNLEKDLSLYPKKGSICKSCKSDYYKIYRLENKDKLSNYNKIWRDENKDILDEYKKNYYSENKDKLSICNKIWKENNKDKVKSLDLKWKENNKDKVLESKRKWRENNLSYFTNYIKNRMEYDKLFHLEIIIRNSIRSTFRKKEHRKNSKTSEILGCTIEEFKLYLESKFEDWMNWENRGLYNGELNYGWDIDHIIPISSAITEEDIIKLNHYTNLQPLCSKINRYIKKDNY